MGPARGPVSTTWAYGLLFAALALGWAIASLSLAGVSIPLGVVVLPLALTLPLFFAGLIFSSSLAGAEEVGSALSANIFGAMLGGFLEYNSMYWGFTSLYPLGIGLYGLALACHLWSVRASGQARYQPEESFARRLEHLRQGSQSRPDSSAPEPVAPKPSIPYTNV